MWVFEMIKEKIFPDYYIIERKHMRTGNFDNPFVELTKEEIEHICKIIDIEIEDIKIEGINPCKKCELILKKLESFK